MPRHPLCPYPPTTSSHQSHPVPPITRPAKQAAKILYPETQKDIVNACPRTGPWAERWGYKRQACCDHAPKELGKEEAPRYIPEQDSVMPETTHAVWHTESIHPVSTPGTSDNLPSNPARATFSPSRRCMLHGDAALQIPYNRTNPKSQATHIKDLQTPTLPCPPTPQPSPCRRPPDYPP